MTGRTTLPDLQVPYPEGIRERIRAEADSRARAIADAAADDEVREWWRTAERSADLWPVADDVMPIVRAIYRDRACWQISADLTAQAEAEHAAAVRRHARETLAAVYRLDPAALDGDAARRLADDSWRRWQTPDPGPRTPAAKAAATRAQTQHWRLEEYLVAAGLAAYDEGCLVYAEGNQAPPADSLATERKTSP